MISQIIKVNPKERPSLQAIINHPWITNNCGTKAGNNTPKIDKKKEIVQVTEIDSFLKNGKAIFTHDQIYEYSRPDSIINRSFEEQNKNLPNFYKDNNKVGTPLTQQSTISSTGLSTSSFEDVKELEKKITELTATVNHLTKENDQLKKNYERARNDLQNVQSSTGDQELQGQLLKEKEKYDRLKKENDYQWNKFMESEKKVRELQDQLVILSAGSQQSSDLMKQMLDYKRKYEDAQAQLEKARNSQFSTGSTQSKISTQGSNDLDSFLQNMSGDKKFY